jgi:hypothetical protein
LSNYTKSTNFAAKDSLASGNPAKIVKGTEIDTEFSNIETAVNSKADSTAVALKANIASPTFTGTPLAPTPSATDDSTQIATTGWVRDANLTLGTAAAGSGTFVDFTGIPSWVKRVTITGASISTNGTASPIVQLGTSGGIEATGYLGAGSLGGGTPIVTQYTAGFGIPSNLAANVIHFSLVLTLVNPSTNLWSCSCTVAASSSDGVGVSAGSKALSGVLDRVRLTTTSGTPVFDSGVVNIIYE